MAKITAPLLSFGGSGQLAKSMVYSSWKGVPYARRYVIPANPQSSEQSKTRNAFSWLNSVWKVAPADFQAPWVLAAKGQPLTDRNLFLKKNISLLRDLTDLTGMIFSPGAKGGLVGTVTVTPGNDKVTVAGTPPDPLPAGWSVIGLFGAIIRQQSPQDGELFDIAVGSDLTDPYTFDIAAASAEHYMAAGWFVYQKSSLATDLAYGPATAVDVLTT